MPMSTTKTTPPKPTVANVSLSTTVRLLRESHRCSWKGLAVLVAALFILSLVANYNFEKRSKIYVAGEIADQDIMADRDLMIEDEQATEARREQVMIIQPPVFDLSDEPYLNMRQHILGVFQDLNSGTPQDAEHLSPNLKALAEEIAPIPHEALFEHLGKPQVQEYITQKLLPFFNEKLANGVVPDLRSAKIGRSGAIIHNLETNEEILRQDLGSIPDAQTVLTEISSMMLTEKNLSPQDKKAVNLFLSVSFSPSLMLNREASRKRATAMAALVEPIYYHLQKGSVVVRKGERVTKEQQVKIQALVSRSAESMHFENVFGYFGIALILSVGLFMTPSGKVGTPLDNKDLLLIALVLLSFGLGAKGLFTFSLNSGHSGMFQALAYPVAGATGLTAMVFAARRYLTISLLLAFFCTIMFRGDLTLFAYYFLGGMIATGLVIRAQNRKDMLWSIVPIIIGLFSVWIPVTMIHSAPLSSYPAQALAVMLNAILSLLILFAFSPILELIFNYTTRFRLMELMSLEQSLMQELMVTVPGTYHHSLVVANMVEAGAKAIGANSLLCKVAALYHDVGKVSHPEYFIENQFDGKNKHDKLAPSMSALILIAHVKKGVELAEKHKLGREISDIIRQHHGTRVIRYFYQKAIDLGEQVQEADYSYPGPRPQTREAAILMLADAVEASSKTLTDPTPARIKTHIDNIVKGIFAEGQLDESELTFKDLHKLSEYFLRILTGIFHHRIAYPAATGGKPTPKEQKEAKESKSTEKSQEKAEKSAEKNADVLEAQLRR